MKKYRLTYAETKVDIYYVDVIAENEEQADQFFDDNKYELLKDIPVSECNGIEQEIIDIEELEE